jgi:glycosyltransferase involved in cell wall biosynthesis
VRTGGSALVDFLNRNSFDHILALGAFPAGSILAQVAAITGSTFSIWSLGWDIDLWANRLAFGRQVRQALRRATALFAAGDRLAEKVTGICGRECHFLPTFRRLHYKMLPMTREKFFLYVGALDKSKGVFDLLRAFARIKKDIWDYRLLIVGNGSQADKVQRCIKALKLRGKVHTLGEIPNEELINYLQRAKALIIPSHSESIPLVFGEAVQTATPMVVTDVGDLGTLVRDNGLGFVARRKSPASLADAMVRMMVADLDIRVNAKHLVERFAPENAAQTFLSAVSTDAR